MRNGLAGSRAVIESIVAQATSSLGSLALMIAAATSLSTASFGRFSAVLATLVVAVESGRALITQPLQVLGEPRSGFRLKLVAPMIGVAATTAIVAGLLYRNTMVMWAALTVLLPLSVGIEFVRQEAFQRRLPRRAILLDVLWLLSFAVFLVFTAATSSRVEPTLAWIAACGLVTLYAFMFVKAKDTPARSLGLHELKPVGVPNTLQAWLGAAQGLTPTWLLAALGAWTAMGAFRLALLLLAPIALLQSAYPTIALPRAGLLTSALRPTVWGVALLCVLSTAWLAVLAVVMSFVSVPDFTMTGLLVLWLIMMTGNVAVPCTCALLALRRARRVLLARTLSFAAMLLVVGASWPWMRDQPFAFACLTFGVGALTLAVIVAWGAARTLKREPLPEVIYS